MKLTKCHECWGLGRHESYCRSRGYAAVGPHPDAPPAHAAPRVDPTPCPCGIAKADCTYHAASPDTQRALEWEGYDLA